MIFQSEQFATNCLNKFPRGNDICSVLAAALNAADAGTNIANKVSLEAGQLIVTNSNYDLTTYKRIFVIAAGKAAIPMSKAVYEILGKRVNSGVVITKDGYLGPGLDSFEKQVVILEASHPIPERRNLKGSSRVASLVKDLTNDDLVICLFSGGGSSLLVKPTEDINLEDVQKTTSLLLSCGATIDEINTIRKHLDDLKGGGLARLLSPATVITLLLSDVVGDKLDSIASGPTVADSTTYMDAWNVLEKYQIVEQVPLSVRAHLSAGMAGQIPETLKPGDPILDKVNNVLIGNNATAVSAALRFAQSIGFNTGQITNSMHGEASQVGQALLETAKSMIITTGSVPRPACLVVGGETTVTIRGTGLGGRNQELALGGVESLSETSGMMLVSLATDGGDGPTDAAGAVVTGETYALGLAIGLDPAAYLERNDSYHYFEALGDLIKTGPTLTNVNDLMFIFGV